MNPLRILIGSAILAAPFFAGTDVQADVHAASAIPPSGSYQATCTHTTFDGRVLSGQCKGRDGIEHGTQLDVSPCGGADIANINGQLHCSTAPVPAGPWRLLCGDAWVYGTELQAYCRMTPMAAPIYTTLAYGTCTGPISVVGAGRLSCNQGRPIPPGSYLQSCAVTSYNGDSLQMDCKKADGSWNFNQLSQPSLCVGDIWNDNGIPHCNTGGAPPEGSYKSSCRSILRVGDRLSAQCKMASGNVWPGAQLASIAQCGSSDIYNDNGVLKCTPPAAAPPPPPPPPPQPTITKLPPPAPKMHL